MPKFESAQDAIDMIIRNRGEVKNRVIYIKTAGLKILSAISYLESQHKYIWRKFNPPKTMRGE